MRKLLKWFVNPVRLTATLIFFIIGVFGADDNSARAETIQDVICEHVCPSLDRGLTRAEKFVQLEWAKWKNRTKTMTPRPLPGRGAACGRLPDAASTARCCADENARLVVQYVGQDPYRFPETPWRAVCVTD
ncbi:MAG: hypothetical protein WB760_22335 [Xanthobacteraceae bacterium]